MPIGSRFLCVCVCMYACDQAQCALPRNLLLLSVNSFAYLCASPSTCLSRL
jgi:hypothetical protein